MSTMTEQMMARCEKYAFAFSRGKNAMADMFADLFVTTLTDDSVSSDMPRALYVTVRERAETLAMEAGDPLKAQDDKSRNSQVSKLANAYLLGVVARDHDSVVDGMDYAKRKSSMRYTALVKGAVAIKAICAKAQKLGKAPSADDMRGAIDDALAAAASVAASKRVDAMLKAWDKLVHGSDDEPSEYADAFDALAVRFPQDFARQVASTLADCVVALEKVEADAKPLPSQKA
jgi:hypothetical protein